MTGTGQDVLLDGRYRLDSPIATGGMGRVWRGLDTRLDRVVAVKVLKPELATDPGFLGRFRTEARHSAALSHPCIAGVFDYGEDDGSAYLVMELVPGEPLSELLAREGALPAPRAAALVAATARGLAAAHRAGLVHRDVKPANLLVLPDGSGGPLVGLVKITDFGIARAAAEVPVTATGEVMGTAAYLAPEQAVGRRDLTPAADLYALGVVLYEALAGHRPFTGDSQVAIALAQVNDPPPPLPAHVPAAAAALTVALLVKDPEDRPGSATAVADVADLIAAGDDAGALARLRAAVPTAGGALPGAGAGAARTTRLPTAGAPSPARHAGPVGAGPVGAAAIARTTPVPVSARRGAPARPPASGGARRRVTVPLLGLLAVAAAAAITALTGALTGGAPVAPAPVPATSSPASTGTGSLSSDGAQQQSGAGDVPATRAPGSGTADAPADTAPGIAPTAGTPRPAAPTSPEPTDVPGGATSDDPELPDPDPAASDADGSAPGSSAEAPPGSGTGTRPTSATSPPAPTSAAPTTAPTASTAPVAPTPPAPTGTGAAGPADAPEPPPTGAATTVDPASSDLEDGSR